MVWSQSLLFIKIVFTQAVDIKKYTMFTYVENVTTTLQTESNDVMSDEVADLANGVFTGTTELTFLGLKTALEVAKKNNFIVLFSDEVGNDADNATVKQEIIDMVSDSQSRIVFLMIASNEHPLDKMKENFDDIGTVIDIKSHDQQETINMIIDELIASEICGNTTDNPRHKSAPVLMASQLSATCTSSMKVYFDGVEQPEQDNDQDPESVSTFDIPQDTT